MGLGAAPACCCMQSPMKMDSWGVKRSGRHCISPQWKKLVCLNASYTLVNLCWDIGTPNVLDFKVVLLLVLVLELLMPSIGSFSTGTNLVSVYVKQNERERKQELPGLQCRINESLFYFGPFFYPKTVFTCALKAEGIPAGREMTILLAWQRVKIIYLSLHIFCGESRKIP